MPEPISHDWHVQPSCQRPNRGPPRRREFSPGESARKQIRLSSKLDKHTGRRISRQSSLPTEFPDDFHIGNLPLKERSGRAKPQGLKPESVFGSLRRGYKPRPFKTARNRMVFRSEMRPLSAHADTEDKKLRKDPFGGPCFEGTLRKRCCFPNEVPWPGQLRTSLRRSLELRCRTRPRVSKKRPA